LEFYAGGGGVVYIPKGDTDLSPGFLLRQGYGRTSGVTQWNLPRDNRTKKTHNPNGVVSEPGNSKDISCLNPCRESWSTRFIPPKTAFFPPRSRISGREIRLGLIPHGRNPVGVGI